jgi:Zn-dependent protease
MSTNMFRFTLTEVRDLIVAAIVLAFLFGYPFSSCVDITCYGLSMLLMLLLVSTAFIGHELAHKFSAQHFGSEAEFRMWPSALFAATALRIIVPGFPVFAAPGAVMFSPFSKKHFILNIKQVGAIGLAGPLANVGMALLFYFIVPGEIGFVGAYINLTLALFNMWPIGPLDGAKVFKWNPVIWGLAAFGMLLLQMGL